MGQGQRSQRSGTGPEVTGEWVRARGHREGYGGGVRGHREGYGVRSEVTGKGVKQGQRSRGRVWDKVRGHKVGCGTG